MLMIERIAKSNQDWQLILGLCMTGWNVPRQNLDRFGQGILSKALDGH